MGLFIGVQWNSLNLKKRSEDKKWQMEEWILNMVGATIYSSMVLQRKHGGAPSFFFTCWRTLIKSDVYFLTQIILIEK